MTNPLIHTAFNQGCDARLVGRPLSDNPYRDDPLRFQWRLGWDHVERCWGLDARRPVRELPRVEGSTR